MAKVLHNSPPAKKGTHRPTDHTGPGAPVPHNAMAAANTNTITPPYQWANAANAIENVATTNRAGVASTAARHAIQIPNTVHPTDKASVAPL